MEYSQLLSIVRSFIGYCTAQWFWVMMSSLSSEQVMSALWKVCVLCVCESVCVWSGAGCPRVVAHSVPHPRLWMYSSETRRVQTMQDVFRAADVFHICAGVTWSRDITRNTPGGGFNHTTTKQTTTNYKDLDLACLTLSFFFSFSFLSVFILRLIRTSVHQTRREILFFFWRGGFLPSKSNWVQRLDSRTEFDGDGESTSCVRNGLRDVRDVQRHRWCQPGFDCEGRDRRWENRRSPKYCFLLFFSLS